MSPKAKKLFSDFHGVSPSADDIENVEFEDVVLSVGELHGIIYRTPEGELYIHEFGTNRPELVVSEDGTQLYALAGAYKFTARGFEG